MLCLGDWAVAVNETYIKPALVKLAQSIKSLTSENDPVLTTSILPKVKQMKTVRAPV